LIETMKRLKMSNGTLKDSLLFIQNSKNKLNKGEAGINIAKIKLTSILLNNI